MTTAQTGATRRRHYAKDASLRRVIALLKRYTGVVARSAGYSADGTLQRYRAEVRGRVVGWWYNWLADEPTHPTITEGGETAPCKDFTDMARRAALREAEPYFPPTEWGGPDRLDFKVRLHWPVGGKRREVEITGERVVCVEPAAACAAVRNRLATWTMRATEPATVSMVEQHLDGDLPAKILLDWLQDKSAQLAKYLAYAPAAYAQVVKVGDLDAGGQGGYAHGGPHDAYVITLPASGYVPERHFRLVACHGSSCLLVQRWTPVTGGAAARPWDVSAGIAPSADPAWLTVAWFRGADDNGTRDSLRLLRGGESADAMGVFDLLAATELAGQLDYAGGQPARPADAT